MKTFVLAALGALGVSAYDETMAKLYIKYSGAAYCCGILGKGVDDWTCPSCKDLPPSKATVFHNSNNNANGFVSYTEETDQIVVSFAGTDPLSLDNWITDIDTVKERYPACDDCKVHKGFYEATLSVKDDVLNAVSDYHTESPTATIAVTGHSLGAAEAVHMALILQDEGYDVETLYTFGQPRVGNKKFYEWASGQLDLYRLTHSHDPVPHLPTESMEFHHLPTEVFYPGLLDPERNLRSSSYTVCDGSGEDPHCSDSNWTDLDVLDHLSYLDFSYTDNYLACKL